MNPDPASLENLHDIVELSPVSWWPLAPGWWCVFGLLSLVVLAYAYRQWSRYRANAYRRRSLKMVVQANGPREIADILKRTALCVYPRSEIAALSGRAWCAWLSETGGKPAPEVVVQYLTEGIFHDKPMPQLNSPVEFAKHWITNHTAPQPGEADEAASAHGGEPC